MIRLLTIHAAKGLEFKVVVVADAGRDRAAPDADEILCLPDGRARLPRRRSGHGQAPDDGRVRRRQGGASRTRRRPSGGASTTSR